MPGETSSRPRLTIAIPTYNRAPYLRTLLGILRSELKDERRVELIVSDNASPDETAKVVAGFQAEGLPIRYLRNETNLGADGNILQCFEMATGTYVWVIGDDDVIVSGGVAKVLAYLESDEFDLVHVKSFSFTQYETKSAGTKGASVFLKGQDLARHVHVFFTFISGNIVNKDRVVSVAHRSFADLTGTNLVQLGWIYTALEHHQKSLIIWDELVGAKADNTGGYKLFQVFGRNFSQVTEGWLSDSAVKRLILNGTIETFFPSFLLRTKNGDKSFVEESADQVLRTTFGRNWRYWTFLSPIAALPSPLDRGWALMVRAISKIDRMVGNPLLK